MGTPSFAVETLAALVDTGYNIAAVFTAPDRPAGRGQEVKLSEIKKLALYEKLEIYQPEKIRGKEWEEVIGKLKPDLIVVAAFGQIIPRSILDIPKYGCINVHASLLPKYRGASPIHYALLNGETETGVTIMKMDAGMDTGEIISQKKINIEKSDNLESLHDKLAVAGAELLIDSLPKYIGGKIKPIAQEEKGATYSKILKKQDGKIDWRQSSQEIQNMIRAFNPWPGTFTQWEGKCLKIIDATSSDKKLKPGQVNYINNKIFIGTNDLALEVIKIQLEGRNCLIAPEFIKGCSMLDGYYCK